MSHDRTLTETEPPTTAAWAWATEHGAPERASTTQLVSWLARGELPPHTLVWKPGWGEWLPAMQVVELSAAFPSVTPGSRRVARAAPDAAVTPPPVPVAHYPRLRLLAKDVLAESESPVAAVSPRLAPAQVGRRALRDLDQVQQDLVTSQVPAAAMLEAARAMKPGTALASSRAEHWRRLNLGAFGELSPPASTPAPRTLSPLAFELGVPAPLEPKPGKKRRRSSSGYGRWLSVGALAGAALGLLSVRVPWLQGVATTTIQALRPAPPFAPEDAPPAPPPRAIDAAPRALAVAEEITPTAPPGAKKTAGVVGLKRNGDPAVLHALRAADSDGFDRVVFEFRERVPGYHLQYIDRPVRDCGGGELQRIAGHAWLEVRFSPARAHTGGGEPSVRERELKPELSSVREIERTCDLQGVVTWVVGTPSAHRYRAFELSAPPRLVVDIDH